MAATNCVELDLNKDVVQCLLHVHPLPAKGLDGALLYERDVSFCCLHFTAAAGVVVPFSQVDAFSFCRKCIYVLNSRHVFCCCGYERGILL